MNIKQNFSNYKWLIGGMVLCGLLLAVLGAPTLVWVCVIIAGVVPVLVPDRRMIFLLIAVFVVLPLLFPMKLPPQVTPEVKRLYDYVEAMEDGSMVLMSFDYDPSTRPELYPATKAFMRHCLRRGHKLITMALWPLGVSLAEEAIKEVIVDEWNVDHPDKTYEYGRDYVQLPYMTGGALVINQLGMAGFEKVYPKDLRGTPLAEIPLLKGVTNLGNVDLIFVLSAGDPGIPHWVMFGADRFGREVGGSCTAVSAPQFYPYLQSKQLTGLLGGLKGAAEYETLVGVADTATKGMDAQSLAHLAIIIFILIGNIMFFMDRRRGRV